MDHDFALAFNLLDEAAGRIGDQQYGITRVLLHNHGQILLTTVHDYTRATGHRLVLFAADDYGQLVAVKATAPDLATDPTTRILKVRAGELTFHAVPGSTWSYRANAAGHTYTLAAGVGEEPMWTVAINDHTPTTYDDLDAAVDSMLDHHMSCAAA